MLTIEISISDNECDLPEHYGYYSSVDEAKDALERIRKTYESEETENEQCKKSQNQKSPQLQN